MSETPILPGFWSLGWDCVEQACALTGMQVHHPVLATQSAAGPQVRTLVLRVVDRENCALEMQTDLGSTKVTELQADPRAQVLIWDKAALLQARLSCEVAILIGAETEDRWALIPEHNRRGYGARPTPATPIGAPFDYEKPSDFNGFAVLRASVTQVEFMQLQEPHRRAIFHREDGWAGQWVVP